MMRKNLRKILAPIASLRLTVALFLMAMFLILAGTLAQVNQGIWEVIHTYFRSLFVWIPLQVFVPDQIKLPGYIPFLGGFAICGLLLINLIAGHVVRFRAGVKHIGMWMIHSGIILLIVGEIVTGLLAYEGNLSLRVGGSSNFTENLHAVELAIIDTSDEKVDKVTVVSQRLLEKAAWDERVIEHEELPVSIKVNQWMGNSEMFTPGQAPPGLMPMATHGEARQFLVRSIPKISGVEGNQINIPTAVVTFFHNGQEIGRYLLSFYIDQPQTLIVGDKRYQVFLRLERRYKPYTIHLLKFTHEKYPGTETPRNFSSLVRLVDPAQNEDREVLIWMNNPLRYQGETFYQASYMPDGQGSILHVVDNPGWLIPYISCAVITLGMTIHFLISLVGFMRRSRR